MSRLLNQHPGVANALCFATPVRDEDDDDAVPLNEPDDDSTLNTCEDTITSTLYFDAKLATMVESSPPMPLYQQYVVDDGRSDSIKRIVESNSHRSITGGVIQVCRMAVTSVKKKVGSGGGSGSPSKHQARYHHHGQSSHHHQAPVGPFDSTPPVLETEPRWSASRRFGLCQDIAPTQNFRYRRRSRRYHH